MWPGSDIRKIQLWSDAHGTEFAVRLSNEQDFKAVSNPAAEYTRLVDESEYYSDLDYNWEFLLSHWVGVIDGRIKLSANNEKEPDPSTFDLADAFASFQKPKVRRARRQKPRPPLKCRYCMLSYNTEKERRMHEIEWHFEKMKKDSSDKADLK